MDRVTDLLPERLQPAAKVAVPALLVLIAYVVNAVSTGDWTPDDRVPEALLTVVVLVVVYVTPNRDG